MSLQTLFLADVAQKLFSANVAPKALLGGCRFKRSSRRMSLQTLFLADVAPKALLGERRSKSSSWRMSNGVGI
jgi:hypothetical protein